jgi:hypothetical protein
MKPCNMNFFLKIIIILKRYAAKHNTAQVPEMDTVAKHRLSETVCC